MADEQNGTKAQNVEITLPGTGKVPDDHFQGYNIELDMYQPDMASVVLMNQGDTYSSIPIGGEMEVKVGGSSTSIFKGQVVGLEPIFKGGEKTRIIIRAMSKLHQLLRKRKSRTWTEQGDEAIFSDVVKDAGLSAKFKHEKSSLKYKHVYQHNQTDLEFLRVRAARIGCHVWMKGDEVQIMQPNLGESTGVKLKVDESNKEAPLQSFSPRLSSTQVVNKVTVKGWNPETKELITGEFSVTSSPLGSQTSVAGSGALGNEETFTVDHPIWSKEEADALAKARLTDLSLTYITGEAQVHGTDDKVKLGATVEVEANANGGDDPFNGKYYVMGITYRNMPSMQEKAAKKDVAHMILRFARDAQKK